MVPFVPACMVLVSLLITLSCFAIADLQSAIRVADTVSPVAVFNLFYRRRSGAMGIVKRC